jgi:hypothetical protein
MIEKTLSNLNTLRTIYLEESLSHGINSSFLHLFILKFKPRNFLIILFGNRNFMKIERPDKRRNLKK